jgi:hypothetical protein
VERVPVTVRTAVSILLSALVAASASAGALAAGGIDVSVPLASAQRAPVAVSLRPGGLAAVDTSPYPVTSVAESDPSVAHAVVRGTRVILVAGRAGTASVALVLSGSAAVSLRVTVGPSASPTRLVSLSSPPSPSSARAEPPGGSGIPHQPRPQGQAGGGAARQAPAGREPAGAAPQEGGPARDSFARSLSPAQALLLDRYLASPSLASLSEFLRSLSPSQREAFVGLAASPSGPAALAAAARRPGGPARDAGPSAGDPSVRVESPPDVGVVAVATRSAGSTLGIGFIVRNLSARATLRADPRGVSVSGAQGGVIVRQLDIGAQGAIAPGSQEVGVLVMQAPGPVTVTWDLAGDDGATRRIVISVGAPGGGAEAPALPGHPGTEGAGRGLSGRAPSVPVLSARPAHGGAWQG